MKSAATDALGEALEAGALSAGDVGGKPFAGSRRRHEFAGFSERTRVLEEQVTNHLWAPTSGRCPRDQGPFSGGARQQSCGFA